MLHPEKVRAVLVNLDTLHHDVGEPISWSAADPAHMLLSRPDLRTPRPRGVQRMWGEGRELFTEQWWPIGPEVES